MLNLNPELIHHKSITISFNTHYFKKHVKVANLRIQNFRGIKASLDLKKKVVAYATIEAVLRGNPFLISCGWHYPESFSRLFSVFSVRRWRIRRTSRGFGSMGKGFLFLGFSLGNARRATYGI
ncbi:MAG: hypothetical protein ACFFFG_17235 [Candidatus Thorarchaeota archaeon]